MTLQLTGCKTVEVSIYHISEIDKLYILCLFQARSESLLVEIYSMFISGKKRRLTLIEVDNNISNMIDVAKVADLVCMDCSVLV